jgi:hypothetical protein
MAETILAIVVPWSVSNRIGPIKMPLIFKEICSLTSENNLEKFSVLVSPVTYSSEKCRSSLYGSVKIRGLKSKDCSMEYQKSAVAEAQTESRSERGTEPTQGSPNRVLCRVGHGGTSRSLVMEKRPSSLSSAKKSLSFETGSCP